MDSRATTVVLFAFGVALWLYVRNSAIANQKLADIASARARLMQGTTGAGNGQGGGGGVRPFVQHVTPTRSIHDERRGGNRAGVWVEGNASSGGASGGFTLGKPVGSRRIVGRRPKFDGTRHSITQHATVDAAYVKLRAGAPYTYITYNPNTNGAYSGVHDTQNSEWEDAAEWVTELIFF
jgi:hypothetical protein